MRVNKRSGFTLLEIIIVVIILAILASVMIPQFTGMVLRSTNAAQLQAASAACSAVAAQSTLDRGYAKDQASIGMTCPGEKQVISCKGGDVPNITCTCGTQSHTCQWTE